MSRDELVLVSLESGNDPKTIHDTAADLRYSISNHSHILRPHPYHDHFGSYSGFLTVNIKVLF